MLLALAVPSCLHTETARVLYPNSQEESSPGLSQGCFRYTTSHQTFIKLSVLFRVFKHRQTTLCVRVYEENL